MHINSNPRKEKHMKSEKAFLAVIISLTLFLGGFIYCNNSTNAADKPVTLRFSEHDAPSGIRAVATKLWFKEIEKQTGGKVKIEAYWSSSLFKSKEALDGCKNGVADIVHISPAHYPKQLPSFQAFRFFPQGPDKRENIDYFYKRCFEEIPELNADLKKHNLKVVFIGGGLPGSFVSSKKITGFADMQGQKWRAGNIIDLQRLKNIGTIPTSVPWSDVYMAIQTGVIDGCFTNLDGIHRTKMDEAGKNLLITRSLWWVQPNIYVMNLNSWNKLSKESQAGIMEATRIAQASFVNAYNMEIDNIVAKQRKMGFTVNFISKADLAKWTDPLLVEKIKDDWVKENKSFLKDPAGVLAKMTQLVEEAIAREK
jgi:TRAP-type C4-dicarboxylate transport system substrate-binding protein